MLSSSLFSFTFGPLNLAQGTKPLYLLGRVAFCQHERFVSELERTQPRKGGQSRLNRDPHNTILPCRVTHSLCNLTILIDVKPKLQPGVPDSCAAPTPECTDS